MAVRSEVYSTNGAIGASSCGANALGIKTHDFGFAATAIRVYNTCGPRMFYRVGGDASTADGYVACAGALELIGGGLMTTRLGLATTSTSTDAGGQPLYSVSAYASA